MRIAFLHLRSLGMDLDEAHVRAYVRLTLQALNVATTWEAADGVTASYSRTAGETVAGSPYTISAVLMGDLGSFDGLQTSAVGEVLKRDGSPIPGLYAAGNDRASIMGGNYPGAGITHGPNMTFGYITGNHLADVAGGRLPHPKAARA